VRCPHCDEEIELAWQAIRRARRLLGLCATCGEPSSTYRCLKCRVTVSEQRQRQRAKKVAQSPQISHQQRSA